MTGITDPGEEYFKDGLWAWVSTAWKKLVADASNFLQVNIAAQDIDVEVAQQTAADLTPGIMGWDGSAWRKLPVLWGYSDRYARELNVASSGAGSVWSGGTEVPAGEVWVVTNAFAVNTTSAITRIRLGINDGTSLRPAVRIENPVAGEACVMPGQMIMKEGDYVLVSYEGCISGDTLYAWFLGYKMKVAE